MADTDATPTVAELIQQVTKLKVRPRAFQARHTVGAATGPVEMTVVRGNGQYVP